MTSTQATTSAVLQLDTAIFKEITAASIAGMSATIVGHPLDTIKVRLQTQAHKFRSGFDCFKSLIKQEGALSLLRGLSSPLYSCVMYNCIQFGMLGTVKRMIAGNNNQVTILQNSCAGAISGVITSLYQTPIDQIKTILQTQQHHNGPYQLLVHIYRNECNSSVVRFCKSLMRAYPAAFTRELYGCAVYFGVYAAMKQNLAQFKVPDGQSKRELTPIDHLISGASSGVSYWSVVYPIDVVKSRMHVQVPGSPVYTNPIQGIAKIVRTEGVRALYFGYQTTVMRSICTSGILFVCYEKILDMWK